MGRAKGEVRLAAEVAGLKYMTVYMRMRNGMTLEEAVSFPVVHAGRKEFPAPIKASKKPRSELRLACDAAGVKYDMVKYRLARGMSLQDALSVPAGYYKIFTPKIKDFIFAHYEGTSTKKLTDMVNTRFKTVFSETQILQFKKNHKLCGGLTGMFEKGHVPANKGKKQSDYMSEEGQRKSRKTQFKKGRMPHNHLPVGTEIVKGDGYVWRKVEEPNRWRQKHILLWEDYYGSPIPPGQVCIFLDGDRTNVSLENLALVSRKEHQYLNKKHLRFPDRDFTQAGINIARLGVAVATKKQKGE